MAVVVLGMGGGRGYGPEGRVAGVRGGGGVVRGGGGGEGGGGVVRGEVVREGRVVLVGVWGGGGGGGGGGKCLGVWCLDVMLGDSPPPFTPTTTKC